MKCYNFYKTFDKNKYFQHKIYSHIYIPTIYIHTYTKTLNSDFLNKSENISNNPSLGTNLDSKDLKH